jgi:hypothetical protein
VSSYNPLKFTDFPASKAVEGALELMFLVRFTRVINHNDAWYVPSKMIESYKYIERKSNT